LNLFTPVRNASFLIAQDKIHFRKPAFDLFFNSFGFRFVSGYQYNKVIGIPRIEMVKFF